MLVTPHFSTVGGTAPEKTGHFSLTGETGSYSGAFPNVRELFPKPSSHPEWYPSPVTKTQLVGFCDWVSIYQRHPGADLPRIADGAVIRVNKEGEYESTTLKKARIEGSHESAIFIRCDGETVHFEGNVSKFGRPDNVFGYSFTQCLERINGIVQELQLPAFSEGDSFVTNYKKEPRTVWTGARITRVDVTQNYATGSKENAYYFMRFLAAQQASRLKTGTHGDGETVDFGRGSRRLYFKVYSKAPELRRHALGNDYIERLADWCDQVGLVRAELTMKSTKLHSISCNFLGGFDMKQMELEFDRKCEVFTRASAEVDELTDLPKHLLSTYRMWQAGDDLTSRLGRNTFYTHRRALLPFGVDIAVKSNVSQLKTKTRVIRLGPVCPPDWYELPPIERKRNGTHG